jgi:hypothetical protein
MTEKYYNEKGEVAVLYSPGFGAGWSTWNSQEEELIFDKTLVEMILEKKPYEEIEKYAEEKWGDGIYTGGLGDVCVEFLPKGTAFVIEEYDGSESITTKDSTNWHIA